MNIYLISQGQNMDYDTYDSAVVYAEDDDIARNMNPRDGSDINWKAIRDECWHYWCFSSSDVKVEYLGKVDDKITERGVIVASFNAG